MKKRTKRIIRGGVLGFPAAWFTTLTLAVTGFGGVVILLIYHWSMCAMEDGWEAMSEKDDSV